MKYLLDASALVPLLTRSGRNLIDTASQADLITTDLGIYETCQAFWKLTTLMKTISLQEAQELVALLKELTNKNLVLNISFNAIDLQSTLALAQSNHITFYDASYLVATQKVKGILVTEDQKLSKTANRHIKTISFSGLQKQFE